MPVTTDPLHGGRWTDLTLAGRQWLWRREDPARHQVAPGDAFVDAGGLEECLPTVRGTPDHGAAWSRPWTCLADGAEAVETDEFRLVRRLSSADDTVVASYRLTADPGYRFVWAAHALLEVSTGASVSLPPGTPVRMYGEAAPYVDRSWPDHEPWLVDTWPRCAGVPMWRLGPPDGSAVGAIAVGAAAATVVDRDEELHLTLDCPQAPTSVALWRNLGGFPQPRPYRSIGVEPMLGAVFDLAEAVGPHDAATVPADGVLAWRLTVRARRR